MTQDVLWLDLVAKAFQVVEDARQLPLSVVSSVLDLPAYAVQVSTDLILLFTLGCRQILGISDIATEAVILLEIR